jgi:hypothetical protein
MGKKQNIEILVRKLSDHDTKLAEAINNRTKLLYRTRLQSKIKTLTSFAAGIERNINHWKALPPDVRNALLTVVEHSTFPVDILPGLSSLWDSISIPHRPFFIKGLSSHPKNTIEVARIFLSKPKKIEELKSHWGEDFVKVLLENLAERPQTVADYLPFMSLLSPKEFRSKADSKKDFNNLRDAIVLGMRVKPCDMPRWKEIVPSLIENWPLLSVEKKRELLDLLVTGEKGAVRYIGGILKEKTFIKG